MASRKLQRADKQPANNVGTQLSQPADSTELTCRANVLSQYRDGILNAHGQIVVSSVDLLKRYVVCGSMLLDVSAMIPHGGWKKWLRENFEVSTGLTERTAQRYTKSALGFRKMLVDREYASPDDAIDQTHFNLEYIEEYYRSLQKESAGLLSGPRDSNDWQSPSHVIEAVRLVLGSIECDPCASGEGPSLAEIQYTKKEDGLADSNPWPGTTWVGPVV